jgi:hypothetical protein
MNSSYTLRRLVGLGLVVAACSGGPAAAITDPPASSATPPAASYYTPPRAEGLAWGLPQGEAFLPSSRPDDRAGVRTSAQSVPVRVMVASTGFDWSDAGVGAASGFILAACAAAGIVFTRRATPAV